MTTQQFFLSAWNWNPVVMGISLLALLGYAAARGFRFRAPAGFFVAGVVVFFLTLASPLNALADGYLFSAHMMQHLLFLLVIPPLLLLGIPAVETQSRPAGDSSPWWRRMRLHPLATWTAGLSAMWIWHERDLCNAATTVGWVHNLQILTLLVFGLVFWWPIVGPQLQRRLPPLLGVVYLFSACVGCTILGILITFAPTGGVCPIYMHPMDRLGILPLIRENWGFTPAKDQQVGGLLMWVPACGIYISGVIMLLARWYKLGEPSAAHRRPAFQGAHSTHEEA